MPSRPRQHQLEDESRTAFRAVLPAQWVFRDSVPDYGLDGEVEIFDDADRGTGRRFLLQLKATDEPDLDRALAISFRLDTCAYYRSHDLPVLIVRYYAPTRTFYVKWFHTFDPYYAKKGKTSITFRLTPEDRWGDGTAAQLASDLEAIRQIRSPQIRLPISFRLTISGEEIHGVPAGQIALAVRKAAANLPALINIVAIDLPYPYASIMIANDKTEINLMGVASFTLHTSGGYPTEIALSQFPYDVLIGVAAALDHVGHSAVAAQLVAAYAESSSIITHPEIAVRMSGCMARAHRVIEALQLSERLFANQETSVAAQMLIWSALFQSESLSASERDYYRRFMKKRIERAEEAGDRQNAAIAHYNLGNHLRRTQPRVALHHYRKAAEYDPGYQERPYYCRELAGILFEAKRYPLAVRCYSRALAVGEKGLCQALYADALMFAGRYRESEEVFEAYLRSGAPESSEWRLKLWALRGIRGALGFDEQQRHSVAAVRIAGSAGELPPEQRKQALEEALKSDALCGLAWFNLAVLEAGARNREDAFISSLMAALSEKGDVGAWCNAMALGLHSDRNYALLPDIIQAAYSLHGEAFPEQMVRLAQSQPEGFPVGKFVNAMNAVLSLLPRKREPLEIRLLGEGSDFKVITVRPPETMQEQSGGPAGGS